MSEVEADGTTMISQHFPASAGREDEADRIRAAAEAVGVSEFDLFRAAYRHWYAADADTRVLEDRFVAYLFHGTVPAFVRHYARLVHDGKAPAGPEMSGLARRERPVRPDSIFIAVLLVVALAVYLLFGLA
jgi:hypothetical protein